MKPEKKKAALAIILGGMKPKAEEDEHTDVESSDDVGLETAMGELAAALKSDDTKAAAAAFRSAMEMCGGSEYPKPVASDEDDEDEDE